MSSSLTLARPYARAAFALAREHDHLSQWSMRLSFAAQIAVDPRVQALLGHPKLSADDAVTLLLPPGEPDPVFGQFLAVLADNGRLSLLPEITALYAQLRADAEHVVKAMITSATALDAAELANLHDALKRRFGREVEIETAVDPELIGGAIIDAGDVVIDGSLRNKLARLESALAH
jgi:F-type H+-transporting ATPase subunit delta